MSKGSFIVRSKKEEYYKGRYKRILISLREMRKNLSNTLWQISQSSEQVSLGSEQVSSGAQSLAMGTAEQASSMEELAIAINSIASHVQETEENAKCPDTDGSGRRAGVYEQ